MRIQVKRDGRAYRAEGACVDVEFMVLGPVQTNTYIVSDGSSTFVVDPAADAKRIVGALGNRALDAIVVTHHHSDHVGALKDLKELTGAPIYAPAIDVPVIEDQPDGFPPAESCKVDVAVKDKGTVRIGDMVLKAIATPGHTPGSMCYFLDAEHGAHIERPNVLISGDTLFCGSIGRTDFEGGDERAMRASLRRLSQLPDDTLVLPGHNSLTTIGDEQRRVFAYFC